MTFQEALSLFQENLQAKLIGSDWKQEKQTTISMRFRNKANPEYMALAFVDAREQNPNKIQIELRKQGNPLEIASHSIFIRTAPELASPIADLAAFQILHAFPHHISRLNQWNGNQPSQPSAASSAPTSEEQASPKSDSAPSTKPLTKGSRSANPSNDEAKNPNQLHESM